jgi:hypothetical protein
MVTIFLQNKAKNRKYECNLYKEIVNGEFEIYNHKKNVIMKNLN